MPKILKSFSFKKLSARSYLLFFSALVLVLSIIIGTFSWLSKITERPHLLGVTSVTVSPSVFFLQSDNTAISAEAFRDNGYYKLNLDNPAAVNYAPKLRIDIRYKGTTHSYVRIFISDMTIVKTPVGNTSKVDETVILKEETKYNFNERWFDNRIYDRYFYYNFGSAANRGHMFGESLTQEYSFNFITGITDFAPLEDGELYIEIRVESVQINRIEAFWGIPAIPS